ncbi:MAG: hypothetical protein MZU91_06500 [Desulfosudis oleivorans]|nr:hypothetical protein [Desulfosudis oleivorans]
MTINAQARVRLEAEAISLILQKLHQREWEWIGSDVLVYELGQTEDVERKERLLPGLDNHIK